MADEKDPLDPAKLSQVISELVNLEEGAIQMLAARPIGKEPHVAKVISFFNKAVAVEKNLLEFLTPATE